jgi:hypothetical protein
MPRRATTTGSGSGASEATDVAAGDPREIAGTPESPALVSINSVEPDPGAVYLYAAMQWYLANFGDDDANGA